MARAQLALEQRRGRAAAQLQAFAEQGSAAEISAAVAEAQLLGLEEGAAAARTRLLQRRNQAERRLRQLIDQVGSFLCFFATLSHFFSYLLQPLDLFLQSVGLRRKAWHSSWVGVPPPPVAPCSITA